MYLPSDLDSQDLTDLLAGAGCPLECQAVEFVCRILTDRHHPFTMARYFDTHWFMNYGEGA
jgi:hypothetical protein